MNQLWLTAGLAQRLRLGARPTVLFLLLCWAVALPAQAEEEAAAAPQNPSATQPAARGGNSPHSQPERLRYALRHSILSPKAYGLGAAAAGYSMASDAEGDRGYGMGAEGFGRRWADRMGRATVKEMTSTWIVGSILRQDPEYYPSPDSRIPYRVGWAASRVWVTYGENGEAQVNASNLIGIAVGVSSALLWNPDKGLNSRRFFQGYAESLVTNTLSRLVREFFRRKSKTGP